MMTDLQNLNWDMVINVMMGVTMLLMTVAAIRSTIRRDARIKGIKEKIDGQCRGAVDVPKSAEKLFSTDATDGAAQQGGIWLQGGELYVSRPLLVKDADILTGYFRSPYLCVSLKSVVESSINGNNVNLLMMGIPLTVIIVVDSDDDAARVDKRIKGAGVA